MNPEKEAESSLEMFKRWLESEETGGLSVAQTGALAFSIWRSGTPLGSYLHQLLEPGPDDGDAGRRQRGIPPMLGQKWRSFSMKVNFGDSLEAGGPRSITKKRLQSRSDELECCCGMGWL